MDLSKIRIGIEVESYTKGRGIVIRMDEETFHVQYRTSKNKIYLYYRDGKRRKTDVRPEIINLKPQKDQECIINPITHHGTSLCLMNKDKTSIIMELY